MTCDNCARLTRELREAREELAIWESVRFDRHTEDDASAERQKARRDELETRVGDIRADYPKLTMQEARLVAVLHDTQAVMTKRELRLAIGSCAFDKILDVLVCRARKSLPKGAIKTVWGVGYQWAGK